MGSAFGRSVLQGSCTQRSVGDAGNVLSSEQHVLGLLSLTHSLLSSPEAYGVRVCLVS